MLATRGSIALAIGFALFTPPALAQATLTATTTATTADDEIAAALAADAAPSPASGTASVLTSIQQLVPDIALILDVAAAGFSDVERQQQTGGHDPTVNGFNFQQLEMALHSKVDPYFQFDANIVFSLFGVEVEEAYGTTLGLPGGLQARFGQFLTRFGRINQSHPHAWDFVDQPFAIGRVFGGEGNRGLGVELSWLTPLPWYVEVLASSTMAAGEATARSFYGAQDLGVESPLDLQNTMAVKQFFPLSDDLSLFVGVSGATGPNPSGRRNRSDVYGVDLYLKLRPITYESETVVTLQTEWLYRRRQVPRDLLEDVSGYAQAVWHFDRTLELGARWELGTPARGALEALDPLDPDWIDTRQRVTANLTYLPTEFSRFRLQGSIDRFEDPVYAVFLAVELMVGAHGAHAF